MKYKTIRLSALIAGSILCIPAIIFAFLIAAYSFHISNGKLEFSEPLAINLSFLAFVFYVIGVIIAWFNIKIGGILIMVCAIAQMVLFHEPNDPLILILQILLIPIGPILLYLSYSKKFTES